MRIDPITVWSEFVSELTRGPLDDSRIRPYPGLESLKETLGSFLDHLRPGLVAASAEEPEPECFLVGNQCHYIVPLIKEGSTENYCFSFVLDHGRWYFQHVEAITIRLDQTKPAPVVSFPDIPEDKKAWIREEIRVTEMVRLYHFLNVEKGQEFALNWFRDGAGFFLAARAWVPFVPPERAFILYACWDLANLHGNPIALTALDDHAAIIQGHIRYFELYRRAGHLRQLISYEVYHRLFETIWKDRAACAGWELQIKVEGETVTLEFQR